MVKVRFAPSPTGYLHIGGARTALYNWLFARQQQGKFVLRIEDTDRERSTEAAIAAIVKSLKWLGLDWDEGPYRQMDRLALYQRYAADLVKAKKAYYCYCTQEELEQRKKAALKVKKSWRYDRRCLNLSAQERAALEAKKRTPVIRFYSSDVGETVVNDLIRGRVVFNNIQLDDLIILRSDGIPTYNFAAVIDDHLMEITHVIRGEDHLPNTPRQLQIYTAFGWQPPEFAHLPLILGPDKTPLSKRHGATAIENYRAEGYLPVALINFLALLGWSWDEKTTIFSVADLIAKFNLKKVSKAGAVFDLNKLNCLNGYWLLQMPLDELTKKLIPFWQKAGFLPAEVPAEKFNWLKQLAAVCQERIFKLSDIISLTAFFFAEVKYDEQAVKQVFLPQADLVLTKAAEVLKQAQPFTEENIEKNLRELATTLGLKPKKVFQLIRVAVSGRTVSPPLFTTVALLGQEKCLARLTKARTLWSL
jgi:glutamyl-tRNA synthetase